MLRKSTVLAGIVAIVLAGCSTQQLPTAPPQDSRPTVALNTPARPSLDDSELQPTLSARPSDDYPPKISKTVNLGPTVADREGGPAPLLPPPDDEVTLTAESWVNPNPNNPYSLYHGSRSVADQAIYYIAVTHQFYRDGVLIAQGQRAYNNSYLAGVWAETPDESNTQELWESWGYHAFQVEEEDEEIWTPITHDALYH